MTLRLGDGAPALFHDLYQARQVLDPPDDDLGHDPDDDNDDNDDEDPLWDELAAEDEHALA